MSAWCVVHEGWPTRAPLVWRTYKGLRACQRSQKRASKSQTLTAMPMSEFAPYAARFNR